MPTYEYRCPDGHEFERFVFKMSQGSVELSCPVCGKPSARRISAGGGFVFKGSGFYITDYGKDGKKDLREREKARATAESSATAAASNPKSESASGGEAAGSGSTAKGDAPRSDAAKVDAPKEAGPKTAASPKDAPGTRSSAAEPGSPKRTGGPE